MQNTIENTVACNKLCPDPVFVQIVADEGKSLTNNLPRSNPEGGLRARPSQVTHVETTISFLSWLLLEILHSIICTYCRQAMIINAFNSSVQGQILTLIKLSQASPYLHIRPMHIENTPLTAVSC